MSEKIKIFLRNLYQQLLGINDSPHRKAGGLAIGVFTGLLPAMGPLAALFLATLFKVNRAAALAGSVLTNTWISLLTLVLAIKIGSFFTGDDWREHYERVKEIFKHFEFKNLLDASILHFLKPMFIGYLVIGTVFGIVVYCVAYIVLKFKYEKSEGSYGSIYTGHRK